MYEYWAYTVMIAIRRMLHICRPTIFCAGVLHICFLLTYIVPSPVFEVEII